MSRSFVVVVLVTLGTSAAVLAGPPYPGAAEVDELLRTEPFTDARWPVWRARMLDWIGDPAHDVDPVYDEARRFLLSRETADGNLPVAYASDFLAWYLLSGAHLYPALLARPDAPPRELERAETALRRSLALEPNFARSYRNLARIYLARATRIPPEADGPRTAAEALGRARELDPTLDLGAEEQAITMAPQQRHVTEGTSRRGKPSLAAALVVAGLSLAILVLAGRAALRPRGAA